MGQKEYRVNVYDEEENVIGRVRYNNNLDYWDGSNWTCGGLGKHKGLTKLRDGRYVLIYGSQWQGEKDYGIIISPERALQEILKSGNIELLESQKFAELKKLYNQTMIDEIEDKEIEDDKNPTPLIQPSE